MFVNEAGVRAGHASAEDVVIMPETIDAQADAQKWQRQRRPAVADIEQALVGDDHRMPRLAHRQKMVDQTTCHEVLCRHADGHQGKLRPCSDDAFSLRDAQASLGNLHFRGPAHVGWHQQLAFEEFFPIASDLVDVVVVNAAPFGALRVVELRGGLCDEPGRVLRLNKLPSLCENVAHEIYRERICGVELRDLLLKLARWSPLDQHVNVVGRDKEAQCVACGDIGEKKRADVREHTHDALESLEAVLLDIRMDGALLATAAARDNVPELHAIHRVALFPKDLVAERVLQIQQALVTPLFALVEAALRLLPRANAEGLACRCQLNGRAALVPREESVQSADQRQEDCQQDKQHRRRDAAARHQKARRHGPATTRVAKVAGEVKFLLTRV
mmetsp:Transcript_115643/g.332125  ORF Transcript_115643/g.332125 Transcript_115643/m.332125 type:complete len:388 (+) Transcript_115643:1145-2308(+)